MAKSSKFHSGRASLCALGEYLRRLQFFAPLREQVKISQKTVKYQPVDKLLDALMGMLCGAKTIAQSNVTMRVDAACSAPLGAKAARSNPPLPAPCTPVRQRRGPNWKA